MDFGTLLLLGFLWFVFNLLQRGGKAGPASRRPAPPSPLPPPSGVDPTQREGSRLEGLLRDLNRSLEEATQTKAGATTPKAKAASTPRDIASEAVSLETDVQRPARAEVDQDDLAEQVVARRSAAAEARGGARTTADHRKFDQRIRQEPADHTAVRTYTAQQLRDAVVWREILGPPTALRDDPPAGGQG